MADPFSALAGASAAIQFLDFSARFLEKTYNVYKAGDGAARNVMELEVAADRLKAAAKANDSQELHSANATAAEKGMATLCDECKVFADQLVTDLASFKENSKPGLWSSAKMVFRADRRREELRAHEKRIEALKAEMSAQLLRVLCKDSSIEPPCSCATLNSIGDRQSTSTAALEALRCRDVALQASISAGMTQLRDDLVSRLDQQKTPKALGDIQVLIERLIDDAKNTRIKQSMIGSLCYEGMDTRREIISETHADTYRWIFSPDEDRGRTAHLREWLRNGDGIFWVSGKPGSGKSTLMKFIHRHPQTTKLLEDWAGKGKRLVTASHFFWINGSDIQKSQTGLLREMCAAVARQCPVVLLDRWKQLGMSPEDWSESLPRIQWSNSTLRQMLSCVRHVLLDDEGRGIRFVFFIDGLDEYSGDHEDLTGFFRQLTLSGNIKMCVAGRPWNVFERALGNDENLKLYMQRLTHEDISTFVQDKIGTDEHFKDLLREDSTTLDIIETIVSRADGVFLWVHLVERQVHRSLVNRDGLETLRRRILQMPADLNEYFQYMFDSLVSYVHSNPITIFARVYYVSQSMVPCQQLRCVANSLTDVRINRTRSTAETPLVHSECV